MTRLLAGLVALFAAAALVRAQVGAPKVQPLSLEIRKPLPPGVSSELEAFRSQGTTIRLAISLPDKHIVDVEPGASKLAHFADDKGTDLTKVKKKSPFDGEDWLWPPHARISKDAKQCSVEANAPGVPAIAATKIKLKGDIVVLCGSDEKTLEAKDVVFDEKLNLIVGPFTVKKGKPLFGDEPSALFQSAQNKHITRVVLKPAQGKEINAEYRGGGRVTAFNKTEYSWMYSLDGAGERCTVRVTFFDKMEAVTVPVDLELGVGF